ncbi:MAG: alkaline shock response membrane anchor protein AmaP [Bacillota bacterium]|jgi:uncharacterized alkaline shock family protein YloU
MNVLRRILLVLWSLFLVAIGLALVATLINSKIASYWLTMFNNVLSGGVFIPALAAIAFVALGVFGIIVACHFQRRVNLVAISKSESGQVNISLQGVEQIVKKSVEDIKEIKDSKIYMRALPEGIAIHLKIDIPQGTIVQDLSELLQQEVKTYVEKITSLNVLEVKVTVSNIVAASPTLNTITD